MHARLASLAFGAVLLAAIFAPTTARAGGCTPCTTSAECVATFGAPAFCIAWDDGTGGCASTPIQCCPGQGCSSMSGRPSCESTGRCHVIDDPDAGTSSGSDAGTTSGTDAGTSAGTDAGTSAGTDAGTSSGTDAGIDGGTTVRNAGGCACGVGHAPARGALTMLCLAVALVAVRRRR